MRDLSYFQVIFSFVRLNLIKILYITRYIYNRVSKRKEQILDLFNLNKINAYIVLHSYVLSSLGKSFFIYLFA